MRKKKMFWDGPMLDSKAVWIHVASLKLSSLELSEFQGQDPYPPFQWAILSSLKDLPGQDNL